MADVSNPAPVPSAAQGPSDSLPEQIDGVDVATGLHRVADNRELYVSVLRMFVSGHRQDAHEIRHAIEESDWTGAVRRAHTVKGLAGTIGAHELQERARDLEMTLKDPESRANAAMPIAAFARSLDAVVASIDEKLPALVREQSTTVKPVDRQQLTAVCRELMTWLEGDDMRARDCLARHREMLHAAFGEQQDRVETAVDQFDFAAARSALATACDAHGVPLNGAAGPG